MLVHVIDFRSRHTVTHTVTTAWVAYELALRLIGDQRAAARVYTSALVHDVGKIGIPLSILEKPGKLDDEEMKVMRTHVELTEDILEGCIEPVLLQAAARHHEKLDGSGYPRGLHAAELSMPDRIIAVADIVSALVGTRSYKKAYPKEKVLDAAGWHVETGKIDCIVVETMTRDYDAIMLSVAAACQPVAAAYERVQSAYALMLGKLKRWQAENEGEAHEAPVDRSGLSERFRGRIAGLSRCRASGGAHSRENRRVPQRGRRDRVHVRHTSLRLFGNPGRAQPAGGALHRGAPGHALYGRIAELIRPTDEVFEKPSFGSADLFEWLRAAQPPFKSIELVGLVSNICVISNAVLAKAACPEVPVIVDAACTASFDDSLNEKALDVLEGLQVQVTNR